MASRGRTPESRRREYEKQAAKERADAQALGFRNVSSMKQFLKETRQQNARTQQPPKATKGLTRFQIIDAYQQAFESSQTGIPSMRGKPRSTPLPQAVKNWYVNVKKMYTASEWDGIYGIPRW